MISLPKISIIIPSYNKSEYIGKTLDSILDQNYPNLEIIVQDGRSNDGTLEILNKFARKYSKIIKLTSKKDKGQADAINRGLKKATGDIVAYLNADDIYEPGALMKVSKKYLENPNCLWIAGQGKMINKSGQNIGKLIFYKNFLLRINSYFLLLIFNYLMQPSVFLTRKGIGSIREFSSVDRIVMEYESWLKLGIIEMPLVINDYLSSFRMAPGNFTSASLAKILKKDQEIVSSFTKSKVILYIHKIHNFIRFLVLKFI